MVSWRDPVWDVRTQPTLQWIEHRSSRHSNRLRQIHASAEGLLCGHVELDSNAADGRCQQKNRHRRLAAAPLHSKANSNLERRSKLPEWVQELYVLAEDYTWEVSAYLGKAGDQKCVWCKACSWRLECSCSAVECVGKSDSRSDAV